MEFTDPAIVGQIKSNGNKSRPPITKTEHPTACTTADPSLCVILIKTYKTHFSASRRNPLESNL